MFASRGTHVELDPELIQKQILDPCWQCSRFPFVSFYSLLLSIWIWMLHLDLSGTWMCRFKHGDQGDSLHGSMNMNFVDEFLQHLASVAGEESCKKEHPFAHMGGRTFGCTSPIYLDFRGFEKTSSLQLNEIYITWNLEQPSASARWIRSPDCLVPRL